MVILLHMKTFLSRGLLLITAWASLTAQSPAQETEEADNAKRPAFVVPPDVNGFKTVIAPVATAKPTKVAVYIGPGAPKSGGEKVIENLKNYPNVTVQVLSAPEVGTTDLGAFDVVVFPGGSGGGQSKAIGEAGLNNVREYVRGGGGYVGICAGAYLACSNFSWSLGIMNASTVSSKWRRGQGLLEIELMPEGKPVLGKVDDRFKVRYNNGPIIKPGDREDLPAFTTLARFRTEMALNGTPVGVMVDSPSHAISTFGKGRVFISSPHPEGTPGLEHLIPRGIFWAAGHDLELKPEPTVP